MIEFATCKQLLTHGSPKFKTWGGPFGGLSTYSQENIWRHIMTKLTRIRTEKDGTETLFHEAEYDGAYPYRIELACRNLDEVKGYARRGRLIGIRLE